MFRTQDNVSNNYINQSRDFQLISRLYDLTYNSSRYNISKMLDLNDPYRIPDNLLPLLATKVGFFTEKTIPTDLMRNILATFSEAVKNKGTMKAVGLALIAVLNYENKPHNSYSIEYENSTNRLVISLINDIENREALSEYLRYVLPCGCIFKLQIIEELPKIFSTLSISDKAEKYSDTSNDYVKITKSEDRKGKTRTSDNLGYYKSTYMIDQVIGSTNVKNQGENNDY